MTMIMLLANNPEVTCILVVITVVALAGLIEAVLP